MNCRYCDLPLVESESVTAHTYWGGLPVLCHKTCRDAGQRQEALECQTIDSDCNDCKHYRRGKLAPLFREWTKKPDGTMVEITFQANVFIGGHCLKFDKPTLAFPNKWTGRDCFEHRRAV